jgi:hypothetical protein
MPINKYSNPIDADSQIVRERALDEDVVRGQIVITENFTY